MYHKNVVSNEEDLCRVVYVDMYDSRHLHFSSFAGPPFKTKGTKKEGPFFQQSIKRFN